MRNSNLFCLLFLFYPVHNLLFLIQQYTTFDKLILKFSVCYVIKQFRKLTKSYGSLTTMRVPGFEPEARAWQARVLPGYTTPASNPYS